MTTIYSLNPETLPHTLQVVTCFDDGDVLTGCVVGMVGKMLLLSADGGLLVIDTRALEGWRLVRCEPGERWHLATVPAREPNAEEPAQAALFTL